MMHVMKWRHERAMRMAEHAVDDILEQRPCEQAGNKNECVGDHQF